MEVGHVSAQVEEQGSVHISVGANSKPDSVDTTVIPAGIAGIQNTGR